MSKKKPGRTSVLPGFEILVRVLRGKAASSEYAQQSKAKQH